MAYLWAITRSHWPVVCVAALAFVLQIFVVTRSFSVLLVNTLPDDAFYYFQIARNIALGLNSTFDGVNLTNGYHPLWMLMLVPIWQLFLAGGTADTAPIYAVLWLSIALNTALGATLFAIMRRYSRNELILAAGLAVWFFNPFNLYAMLNGLETSLSLLLIALFALMALYTVREERMLPLVITGMIGGLMMLARLDNVFYFILWLAWLMYREWIFHNGLRIVFKRIMRTVMAAGVAASLVVMPWIIWNHQTFSMWFTSASAASTEVNHHLVYQDNGEGVLVTLKTLVYMLDRNLRALAQQTGAPAAFLVLLGIAVMSVTPLWRSPALLRRIPVEAFLFAGFVLQFLVSSEIRWTVRDWYFIPFNLFLAVATVFLLELLHRERKISTMFVACAVLFIAASFFISWEHFLQNRERAQIGIMQAVAWQNENLPQGTVIGAFNAGIQGYFSKHQVVNLDGLVNNAAFRAMEQRELWKYISDAHIDYLSDDSLYITYRYHAFLGVDDPFRYLAQIYGAPVPGSSRVQSIYRVFPALDDLR